MFDDFLKMISFVDIIFYFYIFLTWRVLFAFFSKCLLWLRATTSTNYYGGRFFLSLSIVIILRFYFIKKLYHMQMSGFIISFIFQFIMNSTMLITHMHNGQNVSGCYLLFERVCVCVFPILLINGKHFI